MRTPGKMVNVSQQNKLIVAVPSSRLSESMKFMMDKYTTVGIEMLWLKHVKSNSKRTFSMVELNEESPQLRVVHCQTSDRHAEGFFFQGVIFSGHSGWVLRLDDDEIVSLEMLHEIINQLNTLNPRIAYSLPRIWIRKRESVWHQSSMAKPSQGDYDKQIRLFHTDFATADTKLHTPGYKFKKSRDLKCGLNIIHLIWEIENLESRANKINNYESLEAGAGIGKLRYYLPEVFPDDRHKWKQLENQCEIDTLDAWAKIFNPNINRISTPIKRKEFDN